MHRSGSLPLLLLAVVSGYAGTAHAQINSSSSSVVLTASLAESLTMTATPGTVNFTLVSGAAAIGSAPVSVTTNWVLAASRSAIRLYGWFATPTAALSDGLATPDLIPSSVISGQMTTGTPTAYAPFTQSNTLGTANGGLALFTQAVTSSNRATNRSDNLNLKIDLTSLPQLPAGTYTGTLTLQVQSL